MPYIKTNDVRIYYEQHGEGEPLILVAGFTQVCQAWAPLIPSLAKSFQVILMDNRGAGQSDAPDSPYSLEVFSQDLVGLMDELGIESANFIGQSMGAQIIQQLCLAHPDRVKKAVLCAPFAKLPAIASHNLRCQLKMLQKGIDRNLLIELNAAWLLSEAFLSKQAKIDQFVSESIANPYPQSNEGRRGQALALLEGDLREKIHNIPHEILLFVGERDIETPPYCADFLSKKLPNCKSHTLKGMGHLFTYEIPDRIAKLSLDFLLQN